MARRTFRLIKETSHYKPGALYQEECEDGTQNYVLINGEEFRKFPSAKGVGQTVSSREAVEKNSTWFVEVFRVIPEYATKEEIKKFKTKKVG